MTKLAVLTVIAWLTDHLSILPWSSITEPDSLTKSMRLPSFSDALTPPQTTNNKNKQTKTDKKKTKRV